MSAPVAVRSLAGPVSAWILTIALAAAIFFVLSWWALALHLERSAARHHDRLEAGWIWEFDNREDIVRVQDLDISFRDGVLTGHRGDHEGYIALNLRGERIDARVFRLLQLRFYSERPTRLRIFHREGLQEPVTVLRAAPIPLEAGWQTLTIDLARLRWVSLRYDDAGTVVAGPEPASWGGGGGTVATLRLHPAADPKVDFAIDQVNVGRLPSEPVGPLPRISLSSLDQPDPPRLASVSIEPFSSSPERVLAMLEHNESRRPALAYGTDLRWPGVPPWVWLALSMGCLLWGTLSKKRHTRVLLAGLVCGAAYGLALPPGASLQLTIASCLVLAAAAGIFFQLPPPEPGDRPDGSWSLFAILTVVLLVPLIILRTFLDGPSPDPQQLLIRLALYLPWAAAQQALLQWILIPALGGHGTRPPRMAGAVLFGLLHFPNFGLMVATLLLGGVTAHHYRHHHALIPVMLLHAVLGTLYLGLAPADWLSSGAVGMRFFGAY